MRVIRAVLIMKSDKPKKLFRAIIVKQDPHKSDDKPVYESVYFGDPSGEQYYKHHDNDKKAAYIARHSARENWQDPFSAGYWSRWLLWNKKTLKASAEDITHTSYFPVILHDDIVE